MSDSVTDVSNLFYIVEVLLAARTVYGFCRTYFTHKLRVNELAAARDPRLLALPAPSASSTAPSATTPTASNGVVLVNPTGMPSIPRARLTPKRPIVVYMDGCFDTMHFGHANALRQARALGDILIVGICPENEIRTHKGPPVMTEKERRIAVESVKWVDKVLMDVPYVVTAHFVQTLLDKHRINVIVHGDDPCVDVDGNDVYKAVKDIGCFRTIKRTEGVSSTDIVARMLSCTRDHHLGVDPTSSVSSSDSSDSNDTSNASDPSSPTSISKSASPAPATKTTTTKSSATAAGDKKKRPFTRVSSFLPTARRLVQFAGETRSPRIGDRVVYIDGTFDMFHAGHIETLRRARELGDFLLVGIHDDATVNERKGSNYPIMNVHERTLMVLSCRYVDEVIIGAPWVVTPDMITSMNIATVVHGSYHADGKRTEHSSNNATNSLGDTYAVARKLGIVRQVESNSELSVERIVERIVRNRRAFEKRHERKAKTELDYFTNHKTFIEEG